MTRKDTYMKVSRENGDRELCASGGKGLVLGAKTHEKKVWNLVRFNGRTKLTTCELQKGGYHTLPDRESFRRHVAWAL